MSTSPTSFAAHADAVAIRSDLGSKSADVRLRTARAMKQYVEQEARDRTKEGFQKVITSLLSQVDEYAASTNIYAKLGCILLIDELISFAVTESETLVIRFASSLSIIIKEQAMLHAGSEIEVLDAATRTLGHLARSGPPSLTYEHLEEEVNHAISWMGLDRHEMRRHAALFVVTELAQNAPALFYSHVGRFFDSIWRVLCDSKITIRVRAALALRSVLRLVSQRDATKSTKNYEQMYSFARSVFPPAGGDWTSTRGIKKSALTVKRNANSPPSAAIDPKADPFHPIHRTVSSSVQQQSGTTTTTQLLQTSASGNALSLDSTSATTNTNPASSPAPSIYDPSNVTLLHASLLTFYELLDPTMTGMSAHFFEILNDCVMREEIKNHKDPLVVHHVIALLPRIAPFCPNGMMSVYLKTCVRYLTEIINRGEKKKSSDFGSQDRSVAFRALGQLAEIPRVSTWFAEHVPTIVQLVKSGVSPLNPKMVFCTEALECLEIVIRKHHESRQPNQEFSTELMIELEEMIPTFFGGGLSEPLVNVLTVLMGIGPMLKDEVRKRLLLEITKVLGGDGVQIANAKTWLLISRVSKQQQINALSTQAAARSLEQRLGLGNNTTDPSLLLSLQAHDDVPAHPSAAAVAEATNVPKPGVTLKRRSSMSGDMMADLEAYRQRLAIRTLGWFDFAGVTSLPIVMAAVLQFLESSNVGVRLEAVVACCRLLSSSQGLNLEPSGNKRGFDDLEPMTSAGSVTESGTRPEHVIERLVVMALTDADPNIRCRVVDELDSRFRHLMLENPENLRSLFVLVNDQHFAVRAAAIKAIGHITELAPSYVMPALRTVLVRLLTELDFGGDLQHREESAALLGLLVQSLDPPLARPHVESMLKGLLPKLRDPNQGVAASMMATLGEVSVVAGDALLPHVNLIFSVVIEALEDKSTQSSLKREYALHTLSKVVRSTIMSVWPYFQHRRLLDLILSIVMNPSSSWDVRKQAMIALGTLGALDPMLHRMARLSGGEEGFSAMGQTPDELAKFSAERFSLSLVFVVFGGTYQEEEDEFDTDFEPIDELMADKEDARYALFTHKEKTMWLLDQASRTDANNAPAVAAAAAMDGDDGGGELDFVYPVPMENRPAPVMLMVPAKSPALTPRRSGGIAPSFTTGLGASSTTTPMPTMLLGAGGVSGGVAGITSPQPQVAKLRRDMRDRRSSLVTVAAVVAPPSAGGGGGPGTTVQNPAIGRMLNTQHSRRISNLQASDMVSTPSSTAGPLGGAGGEEGLAKQNKEKRQMDRVQRLRALASGARTAEKDGGVFGLDPSTVLPSMVPKGFYTSTVSLSSLVRVLTNPTAVTNRKMAVGAIMKIFSDLETNRSGQFLENVVPHILAVATTQLASKGTSEQRAWPLAEIGRLVSIVKGQFKAYLPRLFELTRPYFDDGDVLPGILSLTHSVAQSLETRSLQLYVPNLLPEMLGILRYERESTDVNWPNTPAVLDTLATLGSNLGDYLYLVLPTLMRLIDHSITASGQVRIDVRIKAVQTLFSLVKKCDVADYASRILHPLVRALQDCSKTYERGMEVSSGTSSSSSKKSPGEISYGHALFCALIEVLQALVFRLEEEFAVYIPMVETALEALLGEAINPKSPLILLPDDLQLVDNYRSLVQRVLRGHALPKPFWFDAQLEEEFSAKVKDEKKALESVNHLGPEQLKNIKSAWDASARTTEEDWTEWMRRFSLALLVNSPSPALESCGPLAQIYEPLAHDLFNSAFAAVWTGLGNPMLKTVDVKKGKELREILVAQLMMALKSQHLPKEILQNILNLAEFMEHDDKPLPLDLQILGKEAQKIQAYAKALHYKEIEFKTAPENTIEALISINKDLDQISAAQGVLDYIKRQRHPGDGVSTTSQMADEIELQPGWFAQLGKWEDALKVYNTKNAKLVELGVNVAQVGLSLEEMEVNTGRMSCAKALGEWDFLAMLADDKRAEIRELKKNSRFAGGATNVGEGTVIQDDFALVDNTNGGMPSFSDPKILTPNEFQSSFAGESARPVRILTRNTNSTTSVKALSRVISQADIADGNKLGSSPSAPRRISSQLNVSEQHSSRRGSMEDVAKETLRFGTNLDDFESKEKVKGYVHDIAKLGAYANWMLGDWASMASYLGGTSALTYDGAFLRAVYYAKFSRLDEAQKHIEDAYRVLGDQVSTLVSESYSRAYARIVHVQELAELQELVEYKRLHRDGRSQEGKHALTRLRSLWRQRLQGVQQNVDVLLPILAIRSMVVNPYDDIDTWLNFAKVARQQNRHLLSLKALMNVGVGGGKLRVNSTTEMRSVARFSTQEDIGLGIPGPLFPHLVSKTDVGVHPRVAYAYVKHLWAVGQNDEAVDRLKRLTEELCETLVGQERGEGPLPAEVSRLQVFTTEAPMATSSMHIQANRRTSKPLNSSKLRPSGGDTVDIDELLSLPLEQRRRLAVQCNCTLGEWKMQILHHDDGRGGGSSHRLGDSARRAGYDSSLIRPQSFYLNITPNQKGLTDETTNEVLAYYERAIKLDPSSYKAWRLWAITNFDFSVETDSKRTHPNVARIICAITGLFKSIDLGSKERSVLQDVLRVLALWFRDGPLDEQVANVIQQGFHEVSIDTWLDVIPQLIARVNTPSDLVCVLLRNIGKEHPQQLLYPLTVASGPDQQNEQRSLAAAKIMAEMKERNPGLVEEATFVSRELIRVAVLWHEMWHEGLEEASRLYFIDRDPAGMIDRLRPLHEKVDSGPQTLSEVGFCHAFGRDLREASEWLAAYLDTGDPSHLNQAWNLYYGVFITISTKQLDAKSLELRRVSPQLLHARKLQLAIPGTYRAGTDVIRIEGFLPTLRVIKSKQRPRVVTMAGSDGLEHMFLLKGHEDLRLDERVMQLMDLVNNLLASDPDTNRAEVEIHNYAVVPLSSRAGVMEWVPSCDTIFELIKEYREARNITVNIEHTLISESAPDFENLTPLQKVEVFQYALHETSGQDVAKVLWLKSANSETWLDRRTNFTRSLASMSIFGYILGLGDRHPSNLMLERASGRVLHIDFGDCFEVALHREKYPEKVPFRLTRMLVNAMEASGVEGNFRVTCINVMRVLRTNRDSVMTMLSAFVHDPLITWALFKQRHDDVDASTVVTGGGSVVDNVGSQLAAGGSAGGGINKLMTEDKTFIGSYADGGQSVAMSRVANQSKMKKATSDMGGVTAQTNSTALKVTQRVKQKLRGTDFGLESQFTVEVQVEKLIKEAMSVENLALMYVGWAPFW